MNTPELKPCPRCGADGFGCYECTPRLYTAAEVEAMIGEARVEGMRAAVENIDLAMCVYDGDEYASERHALDYAKQLISAEIRSMIDKEREG